VALHRNRNGVETQSRTYMHIYIHTYIQCKPAQHALVERKPGCSFDSAQTSQGGALNNTIVKRDPDVTHSDAIRKRPKVLHLSVTQRKKAG